MKRKWWAGILAMAIVFSIGLTNALAAESQYAGRHHADGICEHFAFGACGGVYGYRAEKQEAPRHSSQCLWHIADDGSWVGCVDTDGDGVCDTCGTAISSGTGCADADGDGICDNSVSGHCDGGYSYHIGRQEGLHHSSQCLWHIAADGSWVGCVDTDGDGVCDTCGTAISSGSGFTDENGGGTYSSSGAGTEGGGYYGDTGHHSSSHHSGHGSHRG